ncbi:OmpA family protein [Clostridium sp. NSJ-6]|uniref:OmpA family protein n=1 Tax=Clostridium hominis TaxID=2763036 RepID=A0ABR7DHR1_9CLOT|nr:OmpA family protein [Clostridium hominis]MBC5630954.1 OmpA family protein [Clostridium hominis]MDU2673714.1 OmpA family protein [Clostridium sp.]
MQRRRRKQDDINTNAWMDTYADTITLLLTFFILLYSFSTIDNEKLKQIASSLKGQVSGTPMVVEPIGDEVEILEPGVGSKNPYDILVEKVTTIIEENGLSDVITIREEDAGVILQLGNSILFDSSKAILKSESFEALDVISSIIPQIDNEIMVQGHTDNRPINSYVYPSNWELSTARAVAVVKYFINEKGLDPARFSATGYGENRPLVENTSSANMEINRRVDILIVQQKETTE